MADGEHSGESGADVLPSGLTVLPVSVGDGWVLEVHEGSEVIDFVLVRGGRLDLFLPWSDDVLAQLGVQRRDRWQSAAAAFGFTVDVALSP